MLLKDLLRSTQKKQVLAIWRSLVKLKRQYSAERLEREAGQRSKWAAEEGQGQLKSAEKRSSQREAEITLGSFPIVKLVNVREGGSRVKRRQNQRGRWGN